MKRIVVFLLLASVLPAFDIIEDREITGKVISADNQSPLQGVNVDLKGSGRKTVTDRDGRYTLRVPASGGILVFSLPGFVTREIVIHGNDVINTALYLDVAVPNEEVIIERRSAPPRMERRAIVDTYSGSFAPPSLTEVAINGEDYEGVEEDVFHGAKTKPLSTFAIDVDAASYSNIRRFIHQGQRPPKDAVRIEEMVNYFDYDYPAPEGDHPFSVYTEIAPAPWNEKHHLIHIGLQGKIIPTQNLPPSNLVFLIDVSGSMNAYNKLPLVKKSLQLLVGQLRPEDRISIVVYAGAAGTVLEPTPGNDQRKILDALSKLQAGGATAGGAGLRMAYDLASAHYVKGGNNRVILATDGDFNVGESDNAAMEKLIVSRREEGVHLTVLGYGMGNLKDSKMELLADKGNGNYAYIDNLTEARKVLVNEFGGTLFTIASDVKLQVEFNPARVQAWRLIGYENRHLRDEDFNNDRKDAGDLGSGHSVTALYEIIPAGVKSEHYSIDDLRYQPAENSLEGPADEWMTVKLRYKAPGESDSKLITHRLSGKATPAARTSNAFRWSAAVAAFGMKLRDSEYAEKMSWDEIGLMAKGSRGEDEQGYRSEFIGLVDTYALLAASDGKAGIR